MRAQSASDLTDALLDDDTPEDSPRIEGYRVVAELGRGAGGIVYHAHALASDKPVALKILHHKGADEERTKRAWRELDILADIRSSCVPSVIDYGNTAGRMYIVTKLIDGPDLLTHIERESPSRRARVELLAKIADAVQILHEHGVIHRDLKPSNILINAKGEPVIIDLGIAALIESDVMQTLTADGAPIGTPAYMAPEQARGDRAQISTRSDVYALGAVAYHALTGDTPHEQAGTLYETVRRVGHDEPRDARELEPTLPKSLAAVLTKACARRPKDRYDSAAALGEDLRRWLSKEPVVAGRQAPWTKVTRWAGRHPVVTTAAVCAAMLLGTASLSYASVWWMNRQPHSIISIGKGVTARVLSRSGRVIKEFTSDGGDTYRVAQIGRSLALSPQSFIISSKAISTLDADLSAGLYLFRPDDLDTPVWSYSVETLPLQLRYAVEDTPAGDKFRVYDMMVADVLPTPGPEIISAHCHEPYSPTAIAIHSPDGRLLDIVWHDGRITSIANFPGTRTIVCAGVNSEASLGQLGASVNDSDRHPPTLFAYQAKLDRGLGIIARNAHLATLEPDWSYTLAPAEAAQDLSFTRSALKSELIDGMPMVRVTFDATNNKAGSVSFYVSESGDWNHGFESDTYRAREDVTPFRELVLEEPQPLLP